MNSVEKVINLCKERKIPVSKLEKDCGFGNAYIRQLKKGTFPADRLRVIAEYFDLPMSYFVGEQKEAPAAQGDGLVMYRDIITGLCGNDQEKLRFLQDALSKKPEKTKASFDLFLKTL